MVDPCSRVVRPPLFRYRCRSPLQNGADVYPVNRPFRRWPRGRVLRHASKTAQHKGLQLCATCRVNSATIGVARPIFVRIL
jgi:hypothetical protein